jgi:hypothetical protein
VVWGENSAFEYGGPEEAAQGFALDAAWLKRYGVTGGTIAQDWVSPDLGARELTPYFGPNQAELEAAGVKAVFLGYYFPWDPDTTHAVAREHGFQSRPGGPKTGLYDFADIDCHFISVHHWLKWYKFGFTRLWDNLSLEIRNGRLTRDQAVDIIRQRGDDTPWDDIERLCSFLEISRARFRELCEPFRNKSVWRKSDGVWRIPGFLIPDWSWS